MKRIILVIFLLNISLLFSQGYGVIQYEKVADDVGGLPPVLDTEDWFGYSVEFIGDLNNDSINDIAVSSLKDDDGNFNSGAVYILFMNIDGGVESYQKISSTEGGFNGELDEWDIFGSSISYLGDMNGDGLIEIGVGAEYDGDGGWWHGAIWILSLNNDGTVNSYSKISDTEGNFTAPLGDEDVFGTDIELLGDLDGDGNQDIAVSARRDPDGGSDRGAVYILFLNSDFTVNSYQKISDTQGGADLPLNEGDYFGGSVANIGDLNGDGIIDLAVGAYRDDTGGSNRGAIYILFMNTDGTVQDYQKISDSHGEFDAVFNNQMFFGISIDLAEDINQDGLTEIVVGASGFDNGEGINFGTFYILNLNTDGTVDSYVQYTEGMQGFDGDITTGDSFGFSVAFSNLFSDGNLGIATGSFTDNDGGYQKGSFWTLRLGEILSIEPISPLEVNYLYPNPTKTSFSLSNFENVSNLKVYAINGAEVVTFDVNGENNYNVSYLPIGTYLVKVFYDTGESSTFKLIKG